ncbi:hypothetical protein NAL32_09085 [Chryseobacterium sp. Ch-15]|uniref:Uncharacterized protein n=1 Tax=Chryseobacterium muglaense TaxID=2893752 RepID=A0A9Q3UV91_9FLAO|nr:hypothetical protein [Chryseobacterium muglaense]MBD3904888.1 hypothetical protein [Chryseobacterium muglaense]MCC9034436.1 hypothetical protein [Chryseobacterium muglaense]MCM2554543.1 hypothetical protein [Chryseobacterium muglaense]
MMKLINAIKIPPLRYPKETHDLPESSDYPDPDEWFRKWEEAVSKLNIDFHAIQKDSYLVDIQTIDDENLQIILETNLQEIDWEGFEEQMIAFDGGIVLKDDSQVLIIPTCCGDIGNIKEWEKIVNNKTVDWSDLWIGHPAVFYKKEKGKVQFSDYSDVNLSELVDIKAIFEIDESELKNELEKVKQHQINFKNRISNILQKMNIKNAEKISKLMTGIE